MKTLEKLAAVLTALTLLASCAAAEKTVLDTSDKFDITLEMSGSAAVEAEKTEEGMIVASVVREGLAPVYAVVRPIDVEEAAELSMNDLTDEQLAEWEERLASTYENPVIEVLTTEAGNKYIKACANRETDVHDLLTLYRGYTIELIQFHEDMSELTAEDEAFCSEVLAGIWITDTEAK